MLAMSQMYWLLFFIDWFSTTTTKMQHSERLTECVCYVCVCAVDREGSLLFASSAPLPAVVWTPMYLTGYSDYLTGGLEQSSPPYRCHTGLKNV